MKKNTAQTPEQNYVPAPHKTTAGDRLFFGALISIAIGAISFPAIAAYKKFGPAPTVECEKCHHIVTKASAVRKTLFAKSNSDDKKFNFYFCQQHAPFWSYAVGQPKEYILFKAINDEQCNEDGVALSSIVVTQVWYTIRSNRMTLETNIGAINQGQTDKHINY